MDTGYELECCDVLGSLADVFRIVDNAHLLDATEIFRKLNVHKKVGEALGSFACLPVANLICRNHSLSSGSILLCFFSTYTA
jgi:hypothetical protein